MSDPKPKQTRRRVKWLLISLSVVVGLGLLLFFVLLVTSYTFLVEGEAMMPTLKHTDRLLVSKLAYSLRSPQRGDIVVFDLPSMQARPFIKRVIATQGETVEVRAESDPPGSIQSDTVCRDGCFVYVNGVRLSEPYINDTPDYKRPLVTVPSGHVYVLGDNRRNSHDSHIYGTVPISSISGQAFFSLTEGVFLQGPSYPNIE